ncbi:MAG: ribonucleotide-diphosphate reductase subunit alpha, partial [Nitrospirae bacterium CG_4_10_14_3_um_filter_53_41]
ELDGKPFEVFATIGKSGQSTMAKTEAIGRLVSLSLRYGVPVEKIVEQLKGIGGEHPIFQKDGLVRSIPDAIARILERRYMKKNGKNGIHTEVDLLSITADTCPDCGASGSMERSEGCLKCLACGYSKCA